MHIEAIKEVLAWTMSKYFQFSNNIMLPNSCTTKNKAVLSFTICCYVVLSYHNAQLWDSIISWYSETLQ